MEMKLSNTLLIEKNLLPSYNRAFTLAEVLITLSILGVVAALTIPSLVNRQSEVAAKSRIKKAIANFEQVTAVYMAETGENNISGMTLSEHFKPVSSISENGTFKTADGVYWAFDLEKGTASACDAEANPLYCVNMWVDKDGIVNAGTEPNSAYFPSAGTGKNKNGTPKVILTEVK